MKKILILGLVFGMLLPIVNAAYYQTYVEVEITGLSWLWDGERSTGPYIKERHDWCIPADTKMTIAYDSCHGAYSFSCKKLGDKPPLGEVTRDGFLKDMCKGDTMISNLVQLDSGLKEGENSYTTYSYQVQLDREEERNIKEVRHKSKKYSSGIASWISGDKNSNCKKFCFEYAGYYDGYLDHTDMSFQADYDFQYLNTEKNFDFSTSESGGGKGTDYCSCLKEAPIDLRIDFTG